MACEGIKKNWREPFTMQLKKKKSFVEREREKSEKTMRNNVKVLDPSFPHITIEDLQPGEMFQYKDRKNDDALYMRIDRYGLAVHLATGITYGVDITAVLSRVTMVQISRPI